MPGPPPIQVLASRAVHPRTEPRLGVGDPTLVPNRDPNPSVQKVLLQQPLRWGPLLRLQPSNGQAGPSLLVEVVVVVGGGVCLSSWVITVQAWATPHPSGAGGARSREKWPRAHRPIRSVLRMSVRRPPGGRGKQVPLGGGEAQGLHRSLPPPGNGRPQHSRAGRMQSMGRALSGVLLSYGLVSIPAHPTWM